VHPDKRIHPSNDDAMRGRLLNELEHYSWWRPTPASVLVNERVVRYCGTVDAEDECDAARLVAESIAGVRHADESAPLGSTAPPMP
jgi:osmotically-inducible protein OsmY